MKLALTVAALATLLIAAPATAQTTTAVPPAPTVAEPKPVSPIPTAETQAAQAKLLTVISDLRAGTTDFSRMTPQLKDLMQPHAEEVKHLLETLGDLGTVSLLGVDPNDHVVFFHVIFKNGATDWAIKVAADGTLEALAVRHADA
jgi:hypothetical protein